jgi:hypothetical protein
MFAIKYLSHKFCEAFLQFAIVNTNYFNNKEEHLDFVCIVKHKSFNNQQNFKTYKFWEKEENLKP